MDVKDSELAWQEGLKCEVRPVYAKSILKFKVAGDLISRSQPKQFVFWSPVYNGPATIFQKE
jgi:hypothetical protein